MSTSPPPQTAAPAPARVLAPDLARGFMLLLIALAYTSIYLPHMGGGLAADPDGSITDRVVNLARIVFVHERSYTMFAALFGYGTVMIAQKVARGGGTERDARRFVRRRGWLLIAFGFVHAALVFSGEILTTYGLASLLLAGVVVAGGRRLNRVLVIWTAVQVIVLLVLWVGVPASGAFESTMDGMAAQTGYLASVLQRMVEAPISPLFVLLMYPAIPALLAGAWAAGRRMLVDPDPHLGFLRRVAVIGLAISVIGGLPLGLYGAEVWSPPEVPLGVALAVHNITGLAGGLGYLAVFALVGRRLGDSPGPIGGLLRATGERSLSTYLAMSVLVAVAMAPWGLDLGTRVTITQAALIAFGAWLVPALGCAALARVGRPGPADALMRRLLNRRRPATPQAPAPSHEA